MSEHITNISANYEPEGGGVNYGEIWKLFLEKIWWILGIAAVFLIASIFYFNSQANQYLGRARLIFEEQGGAGYLDAFGYRNLLKSGQGRGEFFFNTQIELIYSDEIMSKLFSKINNLSKYQPKIFVRRFPETSFIDISVTTSAPDISAKAANTLAEIYLEETNLQKLAKFREFAELILQDRKYDEQTYRLLQNLISSGSESEVGRLKARRNSLEDQLGSLLTFYQDNHPRVMLIRNSLEATNKALNEQIQQSLQEWKGASLVPYSMPDAKVFQYAKLATKPIGPKRAQGIVGGFILGLLFGFGIFFIADYLNPRIKSEEEFISQTGLVSLGALPIVAKSALLENYLKIPADLKERIAYIRTALLFSLSQDKPSVILIGSVFPQEGKTSIATNLAGSLAQDGIKTLVVDGNIRRPKIHNIYKLSQTPGLTNYLKGDCSLEEIIFESEIENLSVISAGDLVFNPSEILSLDKMSALINSLKTKFNKIIIDSPALLNVADAVILTQLVNGMVFVINASKTDKAILQKTIRQFRLRNANVIGGILNRFKEK